jgi:hypothetical protein
MFTTLPPSSAIPMAAAGLSFLQTAGEILFVA